MFKSIKSAVIFHFIYKMRKKLIAISLLLTMLLILTLIYDDIFKYMVVNKLEKETLYLIIIKWLSVFVILLISAKIFTKTITEWKNNFFETLSDDEKELIEKDTLMSAGDVILQRKKKENNQ